MASQLREPPALPTRKDIAKERKKQEQKKLSASYHELFVKNDIDRSGSLSEAEVSKLLSTHGIDASAEYMHRLFEVFDTDASGQIEEQEFACIWKMLHLNALEGEADPTSPPAAGGFERSLIDDALRESTTGSGADVEAGEAKITDRLFATGKREAQRLEIDAKFKKYDEDHRGTLSRAEVENAFATEGMRLVSSEDRQFFDDMWRSFDIDKSGDIDREEFTAVYSMMKMYHANRLAQKRCGPFQMATVHRCVIVSGTLLFLLALLVLLVGMTSCDTGTPLRAAEGGTERRALQAAGGAEAHALVQNEEVSGIVTFQQSGDTLAVAVQLQYVDGRADTTTEHSWHVHVSPSEERADCASTGVCSCAGGHYDPTGLEVAGYSCSGQVDDQPECYRGDMAGKFGKVSVFGKTGSDNFLEMDDLVGRSIVIHAAGAATRIACGDLVLTAAARGGGVHALINSGEISGRVQFTAGSGDSTDVAVHLRYKDGTSATTVGHSWHVHEDALAGSTSCLDAGAHFDPTNKEVAPYVCDPADPAECYAGDMSGKHGTATITGLAGEDTTLTVNELVGRSIVIHASGSGGERIACGTINGGDAHEQIRPCGPEPSPTPRGLDASLCGEGGDHHCYFGGSCMDVAPAVCQISGDPHYVSFDNARFDFMAPGYFWAVRSETVLVQVLNVPCGQWQPTTPEAPVGCTHAVAARVRRANGEWVEKSTDVDGSFEIVEGDNRLKVKVEHDGVADSITIKLPGSFYGSVLQPSLCGNFDGTKVNDVEAAVNTAYRNAPGPPPPVRPGVAPTPWQTDRACISAPYRCIDEDVRWRIPTADNFFPPGTVAEFPHTFGMPGDTTNYQPPTATRDIFCNTWDPSRTAAERCQAHAQTAEAGTDYPSATTETECEAASVQAAENCAHAGVAAEACIVDVCATGLGQFAMGNVIAGHDLAVELGVAEPETVQVNPQCTATDCAGGVCSYPNLCSSHGQCIPHPPSANEYVCACDIGWRGASCTVPGMPEQTGVTLHDWACDCLPGTGGAYCEQLISDPCMTSSTQEVHAEVDTAHITGIISFTARAVGGLDMKVQLRYKDDTAAPTAGHNWHVHVNGLGGSSDCSAAGGHYDPTGLEVAASYSCDSSDQTTCAHGDLSGKFGPVSIDSELQIGVDGVLTVDELLGRSIVIHAELGGAGRVACADIVAGRPNTCSPTGTRECVVTGTNEFGCDCLPGWGGADCSEDIDECCSSPCRANQICTDHIDGFECKTPASFSATMEAVAVFVEDVACDTSVRRISWLFVLLVLVCLLACCRSMFCGAVEHVAVDENAAVLPLNAVDDFTMWILFVVTGEQRHALEVMSNEFTIDVVQKKVEAATGVPVNEQLLEFGGRALRSGRKLTSYGVQHGSELVLKKKGGGNVVTRQGEQITRRREIKAVKGRQSI